MHTHTTLAHSLVLRQCATQDDEQEAHRREERQAAQLCSFIQQHKGGVMVENVDEMGFAMQIFWRETRSLTFELSRHLRPVIELMEFV